VKIAVVSHTPIDHIQSSNIDTISVGGPTCYSGLMIKSLSHDVSFVTKIGADFDYREMLGQKGLIISDNHVSDKPTTRFKIVIEGNERKLFLLARCADITVDDADFDTDACIISPIINEVSSDVINKMSKRTNFTFIDPQGFVRKVRDDGSCYIDKTAVDFSKLNVDAIKVDREEAFALTGLRSTDALYKLPVKTAIMTISNRTVMLHNQRLYEITADAVSAKDSTGAGDILAGAYTSAFVQTNDVQWALCYGVAAAVASLKTNKVGIEKIPCRKDVEEYASKLHNGIRTLTV
jgi:sugar/nucleoside kinase (ribokinase family)